MKTTGHSRARGLQRVKVKTTGRSRARGLKRVKVKTTSNVTVVGFSRLVAVCIYSATVSGVLLFPGSISTLSLVMFHGPVVFVALADLFYA